MIWFRVCWVFLQRFISGCGSKCPIVTSVFANSYNYLICWSKTRKWFCWSVCFNFCGGYVFVVNVVVVVVVVSLKKIRVHILAVVAHQVKEWGFCYLISINEVVEIAYVYIRVSCVSVEFNNYCGCIQLRTERVTIQCLELLFLCISVYASRTCQFLKSC